MDEKPKIGVGVIILNTKGLILLGKRSNIHAPYYSIPGGHLEIGETFEEAAIREVKEETDLDIIDPKVIAVTNNLQTFVREGVHYISIILLVKSLSVFLESWNPKSVASCFGSTLENSLCLTSTQA